MRRQIGAGEFHLVSTAVVMHRKEGKPLLSRATEMGFHELSGDHLVAPLTGDMVLSLDSQNDVAHQQSHPVAANVPSTQDNGSMLVPIPGEEMVHQELRMLVIDNEFPRAVYRERSHAWTFRSLRAALFGLD